MRLRCYIIDDELSSIRIISRLIEQNNELELIGWETNSRHAMEQLLKRKITPDVVFLDIKMPDINGIDVAAKIKGTTRIIFVSSDRSYALSAIEQEGMDYLLKPLTVERFGEAVKRVRAWYDGKDPRMRLEQNRLLVQVEKKGRFICIDLARLVYIESDSNYLRINMEHDRFYYINMALSAMEERLSGCGFSRVHKTFLVNLRFVTGINKNLIELSEGTRIPIGPKYRALFLQAFEPLNAKPGEM
ncbi:LytTR family DNA-binding domain-containing protein [Pedobacter sp. KR3-3]|uniref:LytTR family DNA-binding domain-containing protein n=1 Tax=Pedobacter albus TaxID=3113905 RepID=A0ABU7IAC3_9SPHI|nr:LytTR family DNA-binding domain-containing protein [Pedobacter sp. KR3-3]MEE1946424.1 LytTR family DNA-binding domain-containing protein [Pedobacter sp. KR3-3]